MKRVCLTVVGLLLSGSVMASSWDYDVHGPATWDQLSPEYRLCGGGQRQSPLDLRSVVLADMDTPLNHYVKSAGAVIDNGHALQWTPDEKMHVVYQNKPYTLLQLHIHTPSEHLLNGRSFPAEAHLVHQDPSGNILVMGVFLVSGPSNAFVDNMLGELTDKSGTVLHPAGLLPKNNSAFFYSGSLTTPPCTEGVTWVVMQDPVSVSPSELSALTAIHPGNARPTQDPHARVVIQQK